MGDVKQGADTGSKAAGEPAAATEFATPATRRVVVAGDVTMDWNLARTRKAIDSGLAWSAADRTEMYGEPGGAALTARLVAEVAETLATEGIAVEVSRPSRSRRPIPASTIHTPCGPSSHARRAIGIARSGASRSSWDWIAGARTRWSKRQAGPYKWAPPTNRTQPIW